MVEKMRAMVLSEFAPIETKPLKLTEIDRHEIKKPNEILLKLKHVEFVILNYMELKEIGKILEFHQLPTVPGHEVVGKVVEIGNNVTKFKVGDRAGIIPIT